MEMEEKVEIKVKQKNENKNGKKRENERKIRKYKVYKGAYSNINQKGHILPRPNLILDQLAHKYRPFNTSFSL
ncbi:unnamed protein product [Gordionus sp. m RMFG-2023]